MLTAEPCRVGSLSTVGPDGANQGRVSLSHRVLAHPHTPFCACCSLCLLLCVSYKAAGSVTSLTHVLWCSPVTLAPQTSSRSACGALILHFLLDRTVAVTAFTPQGGGDSEVKSSLESAWYVLSAETLALAVLIFLFIISTIITLPEHYPILCAVVHVSLLS